MDTNNNDINQNIPLMSSDNLTNNNPNQDQELKDLLNKYSDEVNKEQDPLPIQPEPVLESGFESQIPPTVEEKPLINDPVVDPVPPIETNNQEVSFSQEKNDESIMPEPEIVKPKNKMNIFKFLFFVSLFLFLVVLAMIAFAFVNNNQTPVNNSIVSTVVSPTPEITSIPTSAPATASSCLVNGKQYAARETFPSEDGCNTCACGSDFQVVCTQKACAATKSASLSQKTKFQQLITSWNSYKEISLSERNTSFKDIDNVNSFWTSSVKPGDKNYDFAQKIIKGSIKKLIIDKNKLNTILGGYKYTFYLTPNYEKWSNEEFTVDNFLPSTGTADLKPLWAYQDKLVWSAFSCGGARPDVIEQQKAQDQCISLTKEMSSAFN